MVKESNPGYAGGIAKRSDARKWSYAMAGAPKRQKDLRLTAVTGIAEARKLRDRVSERMKKAEAEPGDAIVLCVFAKWDLSAVAGVAEIGVENGVSDLKHIRKFMENLPIGLLVIVRDVKDKKQPVYGHSLPLIVEDQRSLAMNDAALAKVMAGVEEQLRNLGMIPDERN
jgi:hypothetical protein